MRAEYTGKNGRRYGVSDYQGRLVLEVQEVLPEWMTPLKGRWLLVAYGPPVEDRDAYIAAIMEATA